MKDTKKLLPRNDKKIKIFLCYIEFQIKEDRPQDQMLKSSLKKKKRPER